MDRVGAVIAELRARAESLGFWPAAHPVEKGGLASTGPNAAPTSRRSGAAFGPGTFNCAPPGSPTWRARPPGYAGAARALSRTAGARREAFVLRHDRARTGRGFRPRMLKASARARRRRLGAGRSQVVHLRRHARRLRHRVARTDAGVCPVPGRHRRAGIPHRARRADHGNLQHERARRIEIRNAASAPTP